MKKLILPHQYLRILIKIIENIQTLYIQAFFLIFRRFKYVDRYGSTYFMYHDTRPADTLRRGTRTDDTTVLDVIKTLLTYSIENGQQEIECVDVGSYIGVMTLLMSSTIQENGRVHSFEPFIDTFERQLENVKLNKNTNNVVLNNCVVLDENLSEIHLQCLDTPGQNYVLPNKTNKLKSVSVKAITLESYLIANNIKKVSVCKIDAEGVDHLCLKGLGEYRENSRVDYFILEYEQSNVQEEIEKLLKEKDYMIFYMVRNRGFIVRSLEEYPKGCKKALNILAVSPFANFNPVQTLMKGNLEK
jgi:FkbM family methyltransferase